jgi:lipoate-protein ligase A
MQLRDISFPLPQDNIDYDDVLFSLAEKHGKGEFLRFWESPGIFVVLGRISRPETDVNEINTRQDAIPVLRRSSGGGTVLQGPGCLNYTLVLSKQKSSELNDLRKSYLWIAGRVIEALGTAGGTVFFRPLSDLATGPGERKISGNAQRRGRNYILHHGTILYKFDLSLISRYLNMPSDIPEYRRNRPHTDFVTNLPLDPQVFKSRLAAVFQTSALEAPSPLELSMLSSSKISR